MPCIKFHKQINQYSVHTKHHLVLLSQISSTTEHILVHLQTCHQCLNKNRYQGVQDRGTRKQKKTCENTSQLTSRNCRWLQHGRSSSARQMLPTLSVAETAFAEDSTQPEQNTPDRPELSEAECDIDTLKKLKLGLRSSLWSRPSGSGQQSDYSIAV